MIKALLWKEWREQRPVVFTGLAVSASMPLFLIAGASTLQRHVDLADLADVMPLFLAALLWPLLAVACGAGTVSNEIGGGTIGFLLSRPASRLRVWLVKVGMGGLALLLIVGGSLGVAATFQSIAPGHGSSDVMDSLTTLSRYGVAGAFTLISVGGSVLLLFASAVFFSTFLSRALTAAAAGLVAALAVISVVFLIWSRLDLVPRFEPGLLAIELGAAGLLVLVASLFVFTRGEMLSGRRVLRTALVGSLVVLGGLVIVSLPILRAHTRLTPSAAALSDLQFVSAGNAIVATASGEHGESAQTWKIYLDGSGYERLTGRFSLKPAVSPDGEWIVYLSQRGPLGLRSEEISLRAVRTDGGADRLLATGLPGRPSYLYTVDDPVFSPDGERFAFSYDTNLIVAAMDNRPLIVEDLDNQDLRYSRVLGWTEDGAEILLISSYWIRQEGTILAAFDPDSGKTRVVFRSERRRLYSPGNGYRPEGIRLVGLTFRKDDAGPEDDSFETLLVDVRDGSVEPLCESTCFVAFDISNDLRYVAYEVCETAEPSEAEVELRLRDRHEGTDVALATVEGKVWGLTLSPSADRVAVERFGVPTGRMATLVVHRDGEIRSFDEGWVPLGWTGRSGVVLVAKYRDVGSRLAVGDADTGEIREVYP
jgi:hypothetical protein